VIASETRVCRICKQEFSIDKFAMYTDKNNGKRYDNGCKPCYAGVTRNYYAKNAEAIRVRDRKRNATQRDRRAASDRRKKKKHPERVKAVERVNDAIRAGKLVRQPCVVCGKEPTQGHHDSYQEKDWLDVRWLCAQCHSDHHRKLRSEGREIT